MRKLVEEFGIEVASPDDPIYSEPPTVRFVNRGAVKIVPPATDEERARERKARARPLDCGCGHCRRRFVQWKVAFKNYVGRKQNPETYIPKRLAPNDPLYRGIRPGLRGRCYRIWPPGYHPDGDPDADSGG